LIKINNNPLFLKYFYLYPILILIFAIIFDLILGDPEIKYHPVQIIGKNMQWLKKKLWTGKKKRDIFSGFILILIPFLLFGGLTYLIQILLYYFSVILQFQLNIFTKIMYTFFYCIFNGFVLKWSFAIKYLGTVTKPIYQSLKHETIEKAKKKLSYIVRRDTSDLSKSYIISASVEVISESSTDSAITIIWFYLFGNLIGSIIYFFLSTSFVWFFLGIPSAFLFRIINTGDSIVGYKDEYNINIGYASAKLDDFSNYLPTRITAYYMLLIGKIYQLDMINGWKILKRDRNNTESINAGWTMSTMAGLLNVQLEKKDHYKLGDKSRELDPEDILITYTVIRTTILIFTLSFIIWIILMSPISIFIIK